jgi:ribosomal protein S18 acetylase RimI-like enzyme
MATKQFGDLLPAGVETAEHHLLVGVVDGPEVGMLWLKIPTTPEPVVAFVYGVEVDEPMRGRGYGRAIMLAAESYAREHGAATIRLHVFGDNTVARGLYESLGYETTNVNMAKSLT